jgi:uncharacterized protein YecE (DUF72 family)
MDITSDFIYVRLHGSTELYKSAYSRAAIKRWAARVKAWRDGTPMTEGHFIDPKQPRLWPRDVFLYFDNTDKLQAPKDALALMNHLGQA